MLGDFGQLLLKKRTGFQCLEVIFSLLQADREALASGRVGQEDKAVGPFLPRLD